MKILFIVQNTVGRGTYLRAFELARELKRLGNDLTILASLSETLEKTAVYTTDSVRIIAASNLFPGSIQSGWDVYNMWNRYQVIQRNEFDIVHGFETRPSVIYPALALRRKGAALFLDWADWFGRGGSVEERPDPLLRNILRPVETYYENHFRNHACGTTVICKTLKNKAIDQGIATEKLCLLYNGFNLPRWGPIGIEKAKAVCGINPRLKIIGYLGSLFPIDAKLMAESFNAIHSQLPETRLMHVGVSNYQAKKDIADQEAIINTGPVDFIRMMTCLSACDILWLPFNNMPANQGRFPLKFTNYLASGRPIVATEVGDIPDFIREFRVGQVTNEDPQSITKAVLSLLADPSLRWEYAENALALSNLPSHSWASRAEKLLTFYQKGFSNNNA